MASLHAVFPACSSPSAFHSCSHDLLCLSLLFPALVICILAPIVFILKKSRLRLPPGPRGLPVVGHLHLLGTDPHRSLYKLSKDYGPLIFLRFGCVPVVVASSPATARLILQTHDKVFACRPQAVVPMNLYGCRDVLFSQPDPYWKMVRQTCATDLFRNKRLDVFRGMIAEEVRSMLYGIAEKPENVQVRAALYGASSRIISKMAIGKTLQEAAMDSQSDPSDNMVELLLESLRLLGIFNVGDFIPWLGWLDLQGCGKKSKALSQKLQRVWQEVFDRHRQSVRQDGCFLDVLFSMAASERMSEANIMSILTELYAAGIDTPTAAIEWALAELITHPVIMKKAQEELHAVVGASRLVEDSDCRDLPYLRAIVRETMRLHPPLPLLVPHVASQQCQLSGFDIPRHAQAFVNVWAIGRDPAVWEMPLEFCPDRFLACSVDLRGQHFELLPFGSGRRACPGFTLGLRKVHLMLANLIHAFNWTVADGSLPLSEKFGMIMTMAEPIVANASLKLPKHLLQPSASMGPSPS